MHKYFSFQFLERIMSLGLTLNKIPLAMRLFVLILICSITLVHASNSYAQNTVIKIEVQNKTVSEVLSEIEKQSDFTFSLIINMWTKIVKFLLPQIIVISLKFLMKYSRVPR